MTHIPRTKRIHFETYFEIINSLIEFGMPFSDAARAASLLIQYIERPRGLKPYSRQKNIKSIHTLPISATKS